MRHSRIRATAAVAVAVATLITFATCFLGGSAVGLSRSVSAGGAAALALITLGALALARTILWNAAARAAAMLVGALATGASGVLTLATLDEPPGRLGGWCAIAAAMGLGGLFWSTVASLRRSPRRRADIRSVR